MTISFVARSGAAAAGTGNLNIAWVTPAANNRLVMHVLALGIASFPATISGWTTVFTDGNGGGFSSAMYTKVSSGTESGNQLVMTVGGPTVAWIDEYHGTVLSAPNIGDAIFGDDSSDAADGLTTTAGAMDTVAGDWILTGACFALSSPSFPSVPAGAVTRSITQTGATLGTATHRAQGTWQTNHRYNISDIPVNSGSSGAVGFSHSQTVANLRGLVNYAILTETGNTPATADTPSASVAVTAVPPADVTAAVTIEAPPCNIEFTVVAPEPNSVVVQPPTCSIGIDSIAPVVSAGGSVGVINKVNTSGPAAVASGALTVIWTSGQIAGNLQVLHVIARGTQVFPTSISGWTKLGEGVAAGFSGAAYWKYASGAESGSQAVLSATVPCIAWIDQFNSTAGANTLVPSYSYGGDADDAATGVLVDGSSVKSFPGNWWSVGVVWASSSPSFPSVPGAPTGRAITQAGATVGTTVDRASATWQTSHRYNISDASVSVGGTGAPRWVSNTTTASLRAFVNFILMGNTVGTTVEADPPVVNIPLEVVAPEVITATGYTGPILSIPITTVVPVVKAAATAKPPAAVIGVTPVAPVVMLNRSVTVQVPAAIIHISTPTPVMLEGAGVAVPQRSIPFTPVVPAVRTEVVVSPPPATIAVTPVAPNYALGMVVKPPSASVPITTMAPVAFAGVLQIVDVTIFVEPTRSRSQVVVEREGRVGSMGVGTTRTSKDVKPSRLGWAVGPSDKDR